jgi:sugar lactone lactonase YvrE
VLAEGQASADSVALDATKVYFTHFQLDGAVMVVPKADGAAATIATGQGYPDSIAVDDGHVYWAPENSGADGAIRRARKDGTGLETLASGQGAPHGIALDQGAVYWANYLAPGEVSKVSKDGGTSPMVLTNGGMGLFDVAVDDEDVYFLNSYASTLSRVAKTGGAATLLATEKGPLGGFAIDATSVYLTAEPYVVRIEKATFAMTVLATAGHPSGVAVDEDSVYFTDAQQGQVLRVPKGGGAPVVLASGQRQPSGIAVDAWCVYWANRGLSYGNDGAVMKVHR